MDTQYVFYALTYSSGLLIHDDAIKQETFTVLLALCEGSPVDSPYREASEAELKWFLYE